MKMVSTSLKIMLLSFLLFSIYFNSHAQKSDFWQHVRFGGGIGLSFGSDFFSGTLAPSAIYEFNQNIALGVGLNGTYNKLDNAYKSTILGGSIIGLFSPIREIQLSAEIEQLNVNRDFDEDFVSNVNENYWVTGLFLGAGYRTGNVTFGLRYDLLYDDNRSVYANPWSPFFRFYF